MRRRSTLLQVHRSVQQAQAAQLRAQQQAVRAAERAQRERERALARDEKERLRLYVEGRQAEAEDLNADLQVRLADLERLLAIGVSKSGSIAFDSLKTHARTRPFDPGQLGRPIPPPVLVLPEEPRGLGKAFGAKKHTAAVEEARRAHAAALQEDAAEEARRVTLVAEHKQRHDQQVAAAERAAAERNAEIDAFQTQFNAGDPTAICDYFTLVLQRSQYPEDFPSAVKLGYMPESRQLVVEFDLPDISCVPEHASYKYVRTGDKITTSALAASKRKALYAGTVAQITLRVVHELFISDIAEHVDTIVFNGYVDSINPSTGRPQRTCLATVRTSKDLFEEIDLTRVEPAACLRGLSASVSKSPAELAPVRPVLELSMVDPRFVQETDVLSELDSRPNLMELTPSEFESLITNLFEKMGLETRLTQPSRDGGVDCVAYDPRPIFGGKVVIQAKRYKHTVGVSAVRDLFGTMQNEGASKGILVTTSGYGKASFEFADGKPLELLSGSNLLFLLAEHAGIEAKIEPPDDWTDPAPDLGELLAETDAGSQPSVSGDAPGHESIEPVGAEPDPPPADARPDGLQGLSLAYFEHGFDSNDGHIEGRGYTILDDSGHPDIDFVSSGPTSDEPEVIVTAVAGVTQYSHLQDNCFNPGTPVKLVADPTNPYDSNAIGVWDIAGTKQLGHLPRDEAAELSPRLLQGDVLDAFVLWEWRKDDARIGARLIVRPHLRDQG